ncbi:hypothetical protein O181_020142 [Austropuccinia psidii MF-1]|uniref:Uncharacterized protein n=1 Tax=Austropuccinia psidii MF-1 TaxID=1389203 RepID=A0A9Q3CB48_9BASI|nr:hypothetical protein [Austropuccinia psidii MF-1]
MKNCLNGCGYGFRFHTPSDKEKITTNYQFKNSAGLAISWTTVNLNRDLRILVQNIYDVTTFTIRVALEKYRQDNVPLEALLTKTIAKIHKGGLNNSSGSTHSTFTSTKDERDNRNRRNNKKKRKGKEANHSESVSKILEKPEKLLINDTLRTSENAVASKNCEFQSPKKEKTNSDSDIY